MFSSNESQVLNIIGRKKITIQEISDEFESDGSDHMDLGNYIASVVRRINLKCDHYKLDWHLAGQGGGRHGKTVWRDKR